MVKFEFTMSDVDAENLMGFLQNQVSRSLMQASKYLKPPGAEASRADKGMYGLYMKDAEYARRLKSIVSKGSSWVNDISEKESSNV